MENNTELNLESLYNPNSITIYKNIENGVTSYESIKTVDLEGRMHYLRNTTNTMNALHTKIQRIISNLTADGWYSNNVDKEEVLSDLCEILEHEPKQTIVVSATIDVEIEIDIPVNEVEDFDADDFVAENLSVDTWHGDAQILNWDVRNTDVS